jgi:hypothetical protein
VATVKLRNLLLAALVAMVAVTTGIAAVATAGSEDSGDEGGLVSLSEAELLAVEPIDAETLQRVGWDATLAAIKERAVQWYLDQSVAEWSDKDLEAALRTLWDGIADPAIETEPEQLMLVQELIFRHEAVCRSLSPANPIRRGGEHCSATSAPTLDGEIPWATE